MTINERVFQLLYDSHRTQKDLADYCGVNERSVASWKARGSDPPARTVFKIAEFFGVSVVWLLTGEEQHSTANVVGGNVTGGTVVQGNGNAHLLYISGKDSERSLTNEEAELLRLYRSLDIKHRVKLLSYSFTVEEEMNSQKT